MATDATAATIAVETLSPKELIVRYLFNRVDSIRLPGLEDALRSDLAGALGERIDWMVVNGSGAAGQPSGLLHALDDPAAATYATVTNYTMGLETVVQTVDGRYARNLRELRVLVGSGTYAKFAAVFGAGGDTSGADYLIERSSGFQVSPHLPAATNAHVQQALVYRSGRGAASLAVGMWQALEITRDPYGVEGAPSGRIAITASAMFDVAVLREAAFAQLAFKLA